MSVKPLSQHCKEYEGRTIFKKCLKISTKSNWGIEFGRRGIQFKK
jgi:hypothetical protein